MPESPMKQHILDLCLIPTIKATGIYSSGMPVNENRKWRKNIIRFTQLDKMAQKIHQLEKHIKNL